MGKKATSPDFKPTHLLQFHPRAPDQRNIEVRCTDDKGNGAGVYEDGDGNTYAIDEVMVGPDGKPKTPTLFEVDAKGAQARMASVLRM